MEWDGYYYCNECDTAIQPDDIDYNEDIGESLCPDCKSTNVDYFESGSPE